MVSNTPKPHVEPHEDARPHIDPGPPGPPEPLTQEDLRLFYSRRPPRQLPQIVPRVQRVLPIVDPRVFQQFNEGGPSSQGGSGGPSSQGGSFVFRPHQLRVGPVTAQVHQAHSGPSTLQALENANKRPQQGFQLQPVGQIQAILPDLQIVSPQQMLRVFNQQIGTRSHIRPYSFLNESKNIRTNLKRFCNITIVAKFNEYLENRLVNVRKYDQTGHHGLSAARGRDEAQHAGYTDNKPGNCEICGRPTNSRSLQLEHGINFFAASAFVGLGNENKPGFDRSPLVNDLYCYACAECNNLKSDVLFIDPPSQTNEFNWTLNNEILDSFSGARANNINSFKQRITRIVGQLNGLRGDFLNHKYPDIELVKGYLSSKGVNEDYFHIVDLDKFLIKIAHYISGLEMIGYYRCFNKFLQERCNDNSLKGQHGIQNLPEKLRQFKHLLKSRDYKDLTINIKTFINQFVRDLNGYLGIKYPLQQGGGAFGKKRKKVKTRKVSLTTLKRDLKFILNNF
jgi:hypothetical protein